MVINSQSKEEMAARYIRYLRDVGIFGKGDRIVITDAFVEYFNFKPSKIAPLLNECSEKELDEIVWLLFNLEQMAKRAGDKKRAARLLRLQNRISNLIDVLKRT